MQYNQILQLKGKTVCVLLKNSKTVSGNLLQLNQSNIKLQTDIGILQLDLNNIQMVTKVEKQKDLFVYVCKNVMLGCKGIRLISSKNKINWPCKYFKNYQCQIRKVCNYNDLPLKIKQDFIDDMHSFIPVHGEIKDKVKNN